MNRTNSLSRPEIVNIFTRHGLSAKYQLERINIGFTNEVYRVDDCVLKLYLRPDGAVNFAREARLYKRLEGKALTPKLISSDGSLELAPKPYIIYRWIEGDALGNHWHELSDHERREAVKTLCAQIRIIAALEPSPKLGHSWQTHLDGAIQQRVALIEEQGLLSNEQLEAINIFVARNIASLSKESMGFIYWDVLLDNIIVREGKMVGLVDLEHVDVVSKDYLLNNVRRMIKYPAFTLSPAMKSRAKAKDYAHMWGWFRQFYPELFDFPDLETRLKIYELEEVLRFLPRLQEKTLMQTRLQKLLSDTPG